MEKAEEFTLLSGPPPAKNPKGWVVIALVVLLIFTGLILVIFTSLLFSFYNSISEQQSDLKNNDKNFTEESLHLKTNVQELTSQLEKQKEETAFLSNDIQRILGVLGKVTGDIQKISKSADPICSTGWTLYGLSCYYFSSDPQQWNASKKLCEDRKAHLVVINGEGEMDFLNGFTKDGYAWIGLTDSDGSWKWVDGTPYDSTPKFWRPGQPDDWKGHSFGGGEDCAALVSGKKWNDGHCSEIIRYVCEKKMY